MRHFFATLFLIMGISGIASAQGGAPTFITNSTNLLTGANFNIGGNGTAGSLTANASGAAVVPLTITAHSGQTADLEDWYNSTPTLLASVSSTGAASFPSLTLSTTPLAIVIGGTGTVAAPMQGGIVYAASATGYASTAAGSSGQVLTSTGTSAPEWTSGGVFNFTSQLNTTSPYSTTNAGVSWSATNSTATNIDVALHPKGTNARSVEAQIADGTSTGGNKRGGDDVDWQMSRTVNTQVANGVRAVIGGGNSNTTPAANEVVAGGKSNNAGSGGNSVIAGGESNSTSVLYSSVSGGIDANASLYGQNAHASGQFSTAGDAQTSIYAGYVSTSNANPTALRPNGNNLGLSGSGAWVFKVEIIGKTTGSPATVGAWEVSGAIYNNGGTATIVGTNVTTTYNTPTNWSVPTVTGSGGNMVITVTGAASTSIRWVARVVTAEVIY